MIKFLKKILWRIHSRGKMQPEGKHLACSLKFALQAFGFDLKKTYGHEDIGYFQGLRDAGVEEAQQIIDAIEKHERITFYIGEFGCLKNLKPLKLR